MILRLILVAERWINLIKTKATVLVASKFMHTSFWCYAVAWVARCYNQKVLGQKPRKSLPEFGQLLLVRTKRNHKLEERGRLSIMAGNCPDIPNGVRVLSVNNNSIQEAYTAHVAPATFSDKDRWFIKRDRIDPNKIIYVSDKGEGRFLHSNWLLLKEEFLSTSSTVCCSSESY